MDYVLVYQAYKEKLWETKVIEYHHQRVTAIVKNFELMGIRTFRLIGPNVTVAGHEGLSVVGDRLTLDGEAHEDSKSLHDIPAAPTTSPWGDVTQALLALPGVPIYNVETAGTSGFMVDVGFGLKYLSTHTLGVRNTSIWPSYTAFTRGEDAFYCFSNDTEWLALFWDYPPIADAYHVDVDALEMRLKKHLSEYLERFTKEYPNVERDD